MSTAHRLLRPIPELCYRRTGNAYGPVKNLPPPGTADRLDFKFVIAVMASRRPAYLSLLLQVLERIPRPESVLLVVSHDGLDEATVKLVSGAVRRLRVKQLFRESLDSALAQSLRL